MPPGALPDAGEYRSGCRSPRSLGLFKGACHRSAVHSMIRPAGSVISDLASHPGARAGPLLPGRAHRLGDFWLFDRSAAVMVYDETGWWLRTELVTAPALSRTAAAGATLP